MIVLQAASLALFLFAGGGDLKADLSKLQVSAQGGRLEVSFELVNAFDDELVERIETGLSSGFELQFRLVRERRLWWDANVESTTLQVFATYDAVSREYLINYRQDGSLMRSRVVRDLGELEEAMTGFTGLHLFTVERPPARRRVYLRARAKLGSKNLFGFIPTTIATDWVDSPRFSLATAEDG